MNHDLLHKIESAIDNELNVNKAELKLIDWVEWRNGSVPLKLSPLGAVFIAAMFAGGAKSFIIPPKHEWLRITANYLSISEEMCRVFHHGFMNSFSDLWLKSLSPEELEFYNLGVSYRLRIKPESIQEKSKFIIGNWVELERQLNGLTPELRHKLNVLGLSYGGSSNDYCRALKEITTNV